MKTRVIGSSSVTRLSLAFTGALAIMVSSAEALSQAGTQPENDASLRFLQQLDQRTADIAWQLGASNADLCPERTLSIGISVHNVIQYAPRYRQAAITTFGFGDGLPAVLAIAKSGPASRAGMRSGDRIVAIDGKAIAPVKSSPRSKEDYGPINAVMTQLEDLPDRPVTLDVIRGRAPMHLQVAPVTICKSRVEIVPNGQINANSNGLVVQIYGKLALWTRNDDELAIVTSHEMAHNILDHNRRIETEKLGGGILGSLGLGSRGLRDLEREADRYGLYLTARAGYDYRQAPDFWQRLSAASGLGNIWATTHPTGANRAEFNREVVEEISQKSATGAILEP